MKAFVFRSIGIAALCVSLLALLSCGNDQRLVSIVVSPQNVTITGVDCTTAPCQPTIQYKAIGFYNHGGKPKGLLATTLYRAAIKIRGLASLSLSRRREGRTDRCLSRRSVRAS